jgi:hypothetical protein
VRKLGLGLVSGGLVVCLQLPLLAQSVPGKLKKGMLWSAARSLLIEKGWQPVSKDSSAVNPNEGASTNIRMLTQLYPELTSCTAIGVEVCQFKFMNSKGKSLQVSTLYTPGFLEPLVDDWTTK